MLPIIFFVIASHAWLLHVIFGSSPTISNLHQFGDSFWLLATEFFDIGLSSDAIAEGIDSSINRDIFGSIQEFGEASDV
jgi:hypothetical protein